MTNDIFRTVRELIQSNKCVLMGNAVNNEGELYDDSVENLTAILAMQDSYNEMLAALEHVDDYLAPQGDEEDVYNYIRAIIKGAISKAQGA
jgi:hypothetical protein